MNYVGFWLRVVAAIIDGIIIGLVAGVFGALLGPSMLGTLVGLLIGIAYECLFLASKHMATPGKMAIGAVVTDVNGRPITFGKAFLRYIGKWVSGAILCIGYIMVAFTEKKQGLHDMIAGTVVVKRDSLSAQEVMQPQQPQQQHQVPPTIEL